MKTIIKKYTIPLSALILILFLSIRVSGQAPPVSTIGTATYAAGTYTVPITVTGFTNAANLSMTINFDPTKLVYTGMTLNTGLIPANAQTTPTTDQSGKIKLSYTSSTAIVLGTPANTVFLVTFTVKPGVQGVQTPLTWSTLQGDCDITPPQPSVYTPPITVANMGTYFINGFINIPPVPAIFGPATPCTGSAGNIYSTAAGMTGYSWTVSAGGTITAGAGTNAITVTWTTAGANTVSVTYSDPITGPALAPTVYNVMVGTVINPAVTGPISVCVGSAGNVYTTDAGMTGYVWTVVGGTITAGGTATSNTATVTWNTAGAQSVTANYTPGAGCTSTPTPLAVAVNALPVPTITGAAAACAGATGVVYTTEPGMTGYNWTISAGGTITAGAGTNAITVTWNTAGAQTVGVNYINGNGCTAVTPTSYAVTVNSLPVPTITGVITACEGTLGVVYSTQAGMSSYVWNISAGGTITAGAGTNSVTVNWTTAGAQTLSVNYSNASGCAAAIPTVLNVTVNAVPVPTITGPATVGGTTVAGQVYTTEPGMTGYLWTLSAAGTITAGAGTNSITVTWTNPTGHQSVKVNYTGTTGCAALAPTNLIVMYYPFLPPINPTIIPQFVDPLPHFAAGLRVNVKAGGHLITKVLPCQQKALSTGTVVATGTVGSPTTPNAGLGTFFGYSISKDNGVTFTPAMWPAFTIEAQRGNPVTVDYRNELYGMSYLNINMLVDQTILMNGVPTTGDPLTQPYIGPIPVSVHLHGGEVPSNSDGGPDAWYTPGWAMTGPGWAVPYEPVTNISTYPNQQEAATLWFHEHSQLGLTRVNVYGGLAGFYFLRGPDEEADHLPGWSGDDLVREITPAGKTATFNGANAYLPEIEIAIQDRMFNVNGELYYPNQPTNPDIHPFWTPEFFGDIMTVNGKTWPYLSVAPRKYRFRILDGCQARMLNLWLLNLATGAQGPAITVIGTDGGLLDAPVVLNPAAGKKLFISNGERYDVVIDFTGYAPGTTFTLMNDANAPYPNGTPVTAGLTDRIMQFIVNGNLVSAANQANPGIDNSQVPANLRPNGAMVKLTNFDGTLNTTPVVKRQLILNEVMGAGGPQMVLINNSRFENIPATPGMPAQFGTPTEIPVEGTTELWTIINTTGDAHPMHIHLMQWQLVSRQAYNSVGYMNLYSSLFGGGSGMGAYPGGVGSPLPYNTVNADGAIGGNPAVTPFLTGPVIPADAEEKGWKDVIKTYPGQVSTYIVRAAPTNLPITATASQLVFPFDPSGGPGYVWHCHIVEHEDNDMMRPLIIAPSPVRYPQIGTQPLSTNACTGDVVTFNVVATSLVPITYQWQISINAGVNWTNIVNSALYAGATTASLTISQAALGLNNYQYRCILTNADGVTTSAVATLTVNSCVLSGTVKYNNALQDPLAGFTVNANGKVANTNATGAFTITGITSGVQNITVSANGALPGAINSTDAGLANYWFTAQSSIPRVKFMAGDVNADDAINAVDALRIQRYFVYQQAFTRPSWVFYNAADVVTSNTDPNRLLPLTLNVTGTPVINYNILAECSGDFNGSFNPLAPAKSGVQNVMLASNETRYASPGQEVTLNIRATSQMQVGAISLIISIPSDLVSVTGVYVNGSTEPANFNVDGNVLRIGWNSLNPLNVVSGSDLITLKLETKAGFTTGKTIQLNMVQDILNELADGYFNPIPGVQLETDIIESSALGINDILSGDLAFGTHPNPFSDITTLTYEIPVEGKVTIQLYDALGQIVKTLLDEQKTVGKYTLDIDATSMSQGVYTAVLRVRSDNDDLTGKIRIVVEK